MRNEASFGEKVIDEVADYFSKANFIIKGLNRRGLYRIRQFYETYKNDEFVTPLVTQISWSKGGVYMAKRKMIQNNLLKNSIAAYFAAIEIHNKPNSSYRYETTTLLLMNAWELVLKAFVKKYIKSKSIFTKDGHTISIDKAIDYADEYINTLEPKTFNAIKENLLLIEGYRNNIVHYYNEQLEPYIFMLTAKAALNYVDFMKKYFMKDILAEDGLFILPLGFKLPFKPEDFLSKKATNYVSSPESKEFINSMVKIISNLEEQGVEDTIVVGFDIYLENVKRMKTVIC